MGDTTTPIVGLIKPAVGASRSTWGTKWNTNADKIDLDVGNLNGAITVLQNQVATLQNQIAGVSPVPIGAIFPWPMFSSAVPGYLECNGQAIAIATYPALFAILGTTYGGDGTTNFGLPDLRGLVVAGYEAGTGRLGHHTGSDVPGQYVGGPRYALTVDQMPAHTHEAHTDLQGDHYHDYVKGDIPAGAGFAIGSGTQYLMPAAQTSINGAHTHNFFTDAAGGNQPYSAVQMCMLVMWIIRVI